MNQPSNSPRLQKPLSEAQMAALVVLLGDEDLSVVQTAQDALRSGGSSTIQWLRSRRLDPVPAVRRRVQQLLFEVDSAEAENEFMAFLLRNGEHFDLEEGVWRFTRTRYPEESLEAMIALFDAYGDEVRNQVGPWKTGEQILRGINHFVFDELKLRGNESDYYHPENSYVNRVLLRRIGIPLSMSLIILFIAKRLDLPVAGIGLPGHFLCRYQSSTEEYYIDAFHEGRFLSRWDCKRRLRNLAVEFHESHLQPVSERRILQRMVANLHIIHKEGKRKDEAERMQRYLVALAR